MIEDTDDFIERRKVHRVVIDSLDNGAGTNFRWLVRGVWTIIAVLVAGAFWMGAEARQVDHNTEHLDLIAEQHLEIVNALSRVGVNDEAQQRDIERLKDEQN